MKNSKLYSLILIFAAALLCVQCTTDPIPGPSGQDGIDGVDGVDGLDGVNGTTECAQCHNVSKSEEVHSSYLFSGHAAGGAVSYAGSRGGCAQCHSNEGYIDYMEYGMTAEGYDNPTAIGCTTCHDMHTSFDFEGDGYDYALRSIAPVDLIVDPGYTIDYAGTSNTCASCHQPRTAPPVDNGMGLFQVTSTHWGPHHGPQATLLEGIQGAEIEGDVEYPDPASAGHRKGASCTSCHMGESDGDINGLHTWVPTTSDCAKCHSNGIPEEVGGFKEDMATLLTQLEEIGILHSEVVDDVLEVHPVPGTYDILAAEAAWNYILIYEDASGGTHNPKYAKALIQNSIEALNNAD